MLFSIYLTKIRENEAKQNQRQDKTRQEKDTKRESEKNKLLSWEIMQFKFFSRIYEICTMFVQCVSDVFC